MLYYTLKVIYKDGTGHTYTQLTRQDIADLTTAQFRPGLDRPETVLIITERKGK